MPLTPADILAEAKDQTHTRVESAFILQRQDLQTAYERLQLELRGLERRKGVAAEMAEVAKRLEEAEAEMADALVEYQFRNIGYQAWTDLVRRHPPTKEQKSAGDDTNVDAHRPAALAAACVQPEGADAEFFTQIAAVYSPTQFEILWLACWKANMGTATLPKAVAAKFGLTRGSIAPSVTSASETAAQSLPASSLDE